MSLATLTDVRSMGNIPSGIGDAVLQPHLDSAARELKDWIGTYTGATGDKRARCIEAECCLTIAFALPVLNTFYTPGIPTIQKELGELDFMFHDVDDLDKLIEKWKDRARSAVANWVDLGDKKRIGWFAI